MQEKIGKRAGDGVIGERNPLKVLFQEKNQVMYDFKTEGGVG